jgi:hypothetical protein
MDVIINKATRTAKFTKCGKQKGFTITLNWHGASISRPYPTEYFFDVVFLCEYIKRFGTQRQIDLVMFNQIEEIK